MYIYVKRLLDIVFASSILLFFAPLLLFLALVIKLDSRGPIIFRQKRFGQEGKIFTIYKFRTMKQSAPKNHPTNDLVNPQRFITRSGKIMRKLSLDELPQLVNVLRGDMSIVGPRPVILKETDLIAEREKHGANGVKPGITGWAQVNGRDELNIVEKAKKDGEYARAISFLTDLKCVALTIWTVVSRNGHIESSRSKRSQLTSPEYEAEV